MTARLSFDRDALATLCRRFGVRRLWLFGSAATDDFDARSDVDLLVEFGEFGEVASSRFDAYFGFKEALEALVARRVDLVMPTALENPYFAESVLRTRQELYAA